MQNTKLMSFLILLKRVVIVRKIASRFPQVGWVNSKSEEKKRLPSMWWSHSESVASESRNQSQEILSWGTWLALAASQPLGICAAAAAVQKRRPSREHCWAWAWAWARQACSHKLAGEGGFLVWSDRILNSNLFVQDSCLKSQKWALWTKLGPVSQCFRGLDEH